VFVPQSRPMRPAAIEWTPTGGSNKPIRPENPAAVEWTRTGGPSMSARPPVRPPRPSMEWTPASTNKPRPGSVVTGVQFGQQPVASRPLFTSQMAWPQTLTRTSAFGSNPARPLQHQFTSAADDGSQGMDVDFASSDNSATAGVQTQTVNAAPLQRQPQRVAQRTQKDSTGAAPIQSIYDILGIAEQGPPSVASSSARGRRAYHKTSTPVPAAVSAPTPTSPVPSFLAAPTATTWLAEPTAAKSLPAATLVSQDMPAKPLAAGVFSVQSRSLFNGPTQTFTPAPKTTEPKTTEPTSPEAEKPADTDLSNGNPLRAMASLDDIDLDSDDNSSTASTTKAPPVINTPTLASKPPIIAAIAQPETKESVTTDIQVLTKTRVVPPPRETRTSSPRLGVATPAGSIESAVPKVMSFQEIIERKRRKQAEAVASGDSNGQTTLVLPEVSVAKTLASKRRIIDDDDDVDSDASEGKRARPEPAKVTLAPKELPAPIELPTPKELPAPKELPTPKDELVSTAKPLPDNVPDYVAMFEKELEELSADLEGPLENMPAGDLISHATLSNTYVDTDIEQLLLGL
ncbi:hypothetical protein GGH92_007741, partial [Coemansia sp. RSA 2673]